MGLQLFVPSASLPTGGGVPGAELRARRCGKRCIVVMVSGRGSSPRAWFPEGMLRQLQSEKETEMQRLEEFLDNRPDHPLSLRMGFISRTPGFKLSRSLRRGDGAISFIAEMKRRGLSTVPGELGPDLDPNLDMFQKGMELHVHGVDALMVSTDTPRYGCSMDDLVTISTRLKRASLGDDTPPLIRQDFIVHPIQIAEAAEAGADGVLIIAALCLSDLEELLNSASLMGLEAIVECHSELERDMAMEAGATLLYFTNLNRATNQYVAGRAEMLAKDMPEWIITIGGGGISTASEAWSLVDSGFDSVVMGKQLMQTRRAKELIGESRLRRRGPDLKFFEGFGMPPPGGTGAVDFLQ